MLTATPGTPNAPAAPGTPNAPAAPGTTPAWFVTPGIVARVTYTTMDGKPAVRYSINLTSFGMGGAVAARANRSSKALGGQTSFLIATLATTLEYGGRNVTLTLDNSKAIEAKITNVAVGNEDIALFEIARVYRANGDLPDERWHVAGIVDGGIAEAKWAIEQLYGALKIAHDMPAEFWEKLK